MDHKDENGRDAVHQEYIQLIVLCILSNSFFSFLQILYYFLMMIDTLVFMNAVTLFFHMMHDAVLGQSCRPLQGASVYLRLSWSEDCIPQGFLWQYHKTISRNLTVKVNRKPRNRQHGRSETDNASFMKSMIPVSHYSEHEGK